MYIHTLVERAHTEVILYAEKIDTRRKIHPTLNHYMDTYVTLNSTKVRIFLSKYTPLHGRQWHKIS